MFKRVLRTKGFWRSVVMLSLIYMAVLVMLQFLFFPMEVVLVKLLTAAYIITLAIAGLICAFAVTYGKFWKKLKLEDHKNR